MKLAFTQKPSTSYKAVKASTSIKDLPASDIRLGKKLYSNLNSCLDILDQLSTEAFKSFDGASMFDDLMTYARELENDLTGAGENI